FLTPIEADCPRWLGPAHPVSLRAAYTLGIAHLQLGAAAEARDLLEGAYEGQLAVLGPLHYETLRSKIDLSGALFVTRGRARARTLAREVRRDRARQIGRGNDLYGRAVVTDLLVGYVPRPVLDFALSSLRWWDRRRR